jgi:hypothetical protein
MWQVDPSSSTRDATTVATAAVRGTAPRAARALLSLNERRLQELFVEQLATAIADEVQSDTVMTNFAIKLEDWHGVGPVDVAICGEDFEPIAFFEL